MSERPITTVTPRETRLAGPCPDWTTSLLDVYTSSPSSFGPIEYRATERCVHPVGTDDPHWPVVATARVTAGVRLDGEVFSLLGSLTVTAGREDIGYAGSLLWAVIEDLSHRIGAGKLVGDPEQAWQSPEACDAIAAMVRAGRMLSARQAGDRVAEGGL